MAFQKVEFSFPDEDQKDEIEIESSSAVEMEVPGKSPKSDTPRKSVDTADDDDLEIEVVDDTPKADRNRKPSDPPAEVTDDELEEYSDKVRKRIQHFSKGYHDERRAKEQAFRERQELERLAQQLVEENKQLKGSVNKNQTALLEQAKRSTATELEQAKRAYKEAYEAGDADAVLEAQETLTNVKLKADKLQNFKLPTLQEDETAVASQPQRSAPVTVDSRAQDWAKTNSWFGNDDEMTSFALGLHNKLVKQGVSPQSDDYYETIDARMRQVFPDQFEDTEEQTNEKPKRKANVVAPATRSTAPRKVRLTQTQVAIANKLGVSLEDYARQVAIEMRKTNG
jgi:hypothetical protein